MTLYKLKHFFIYRFGSRSGIVIVLIILNTIVSLAQNQNTVGNSWEEVLRNKKGTIPIYWFESRPFIFQNADGSLTGIEYDLITAFKSFVKKQYNIDLEIKWIKAKEFSNVLDRVVANPSPCFGISAFSKTPERKLKVDYGPTYMADIIVLISNKNVPITESANQFKSIFNNLTAITIPGTTYELELLNLRRNQEMNFKIEYISSDANILEEVGKRKDSFGFIDLPIYLMFYNNDPSINARRQNFYPINREGYGFLLQKNSDWSQPINEFFAQMDHEHDLENIIGKYLDVELYHLNERLALESNRHEELLAKEKEIQYQDLIDKGKEIESRTRTNYILAGLVAIAIGFSAVIVIQYLKRNQQKNQIESQQARIELTNRQLEQRNRHLLALDEEKNNLIKILAHDMRQPLSQIEGLSQLLKGELLTTENERKEALHSITEASQRLSRMIVNILNVDAIESKRVDFIAESLEVVPLVKKVLDSFSEFSTKKSIKILPEFNELDLKIKVDALYLTQIIENLVSNALKFSPSGSSVQVSVFQANDKVRISIKDEGPGILEEDMDKLFMKFQKLSARPTGGESSIGLGLAIVKKYTELMSGKVWCKSTPGKGATFVVEFDKA